MPGRNWTPEQARAAAAREGRGYEPGTEPVLFAGFVISNSEVGDGAWSITPRIVAEICGNGLQITADVARAVHLGARQDEGIVRYTADTLDKELALITARARDAVATFLSTGYLLAKVTEIERKAGVPVSHPESTVRQVAKAAKFSDEMADPILAHFIRGGQLTAGGVMQAVTSVAQTLDDADTAHDLEAQALRVLDLAASAYLASPDPRCVRSGGLCHPGQREDLPWPMARSHRPAGPAYTAAALNDIHSC